MRAKAGAAFTFKGVDEKRRGTVQDVNTFESIAGAIGNMCALWAIDEDRRVKSDGAHSIRALSMGRRQRIGT